MPLILAEIPRNRLRYGRLWVAEDEHATHLEVLGENGPWDAYGKADSQAALEASNRSRSPTLPYGDHPFGRYRVTGTVGPMEALLRTFGAGRVVLDPVEGEALEAKRRGRYGLLIHGGALDGQRRLRATHGCLRVQDFAAEALLRAVLHYGIQEYLCRPLEDERA